jgi:hypothetical protein
VSGVKGLLDLSVPLREGADPLRSSSMAHGVAVSIKPNTSSRPNPSGTTAGAVHEKKIEPADNQTACPEGKFGRDYSG